MPRTTERYLIDAFYEDENGDGYSPDDMRLVSEYDDFDEVIEDAREYFFKNLRKVEDGETLRVSIRIEEYDEENDVYTGEQTVLSLEDLGEIDHMECVNAGGKWFEHSDDNWMCVAKNWKGRK